MNAYGSPYGDGRREMAAYLTRVGAGAATSGYGLYDIFTGDTNGLNSGEIPMNYGLALTTSALGGGTGYALGGLLTPPQPEVGGRDIRRSRRAQYGSAIGALTAAPFAINAMRDQEPPGLTSNIPMQEVQELNDLLGANGAY